MIEISPLVFALVKQGRFCFNFAMSTDLQQLQNIGPKMEQYMEIIGVSSVAQFRLLGAVEVTKRLFRKGLVNPHVMYFHALVAAEQDRDIFSFDRVEKAELKVEFADILAEIS